MLCITESLRKFQHRLKDGTGRVETFHTYLTTVLSFRNRRNEGVQETIMGHPDGGDARSSKR